MCRDHAASILNRKVRSLRLITCHFRQWMFISCYSEWTGIESTTMGLPLEGLVMGSRSGSVMLGLSIHLLRQPDMDVEKLVAY
ncbi:MAG: hypothetical protein M1G31_01825 [Pseudanabaena sp. Salubria-1]|nr:hypothetical protein [Pseudanabaena sp. Salubria-1]